VHSTYELAKHAATVISECVTSGVKVVEPSAEAEEEWWNVLLSHMVDSSKFITECTPGYFNNEGQQDMSKIKNSPFLGGTMKYVELLRLWRDEADMSGLVIRK
jgi:cyclohexanone monooxygenase